MTVDRDSPIPLYQQIASQLRQKIEDGTLNPGSKLPNEEALRQAYQTSRVTVRNAIAILAEEGLVDRRHGKGTYVRTDVVSVEMGSLQGFYGALKRTGASVTTELLQCDTSLPPPEVKDALSIVANQPVQRLERLYRVNQLPLAITTSYLWKDLGVEFDQAAATTVYGLLAHYLSMSLQEAHWTISAEPASARISQLLHIAVNSPLLVLARSTLSEDGVPREFTVHRVVSRLYRVHFALHRDTHPIEEDFFITNGSPS